MSRWPQGVKQVLATRQAGRIISVEALPVEVIDVQAEEDRMPLDTNRDEYWEKLVDGVRAGLKPDFDALRDDLAAKMDSQALDLRGAMDSQAAENKLRFDTLDESLLAIKKHLGI